ncbi:MAG: LysM peptidoglycan-binding domain-containing protein, partial [Deltaproteobacteria bacterium]
AIKYLRELHRIFGDWTTALAAYNCGENLVLRLIKRQGINYLDDFWDLYQRLPEQTRRYVPKFIAVLNIVKQPEKFGFELPEPEKPPEVEEIEITKRLHLKDIARVLGVGQDVLVGLNPELRRKVVPSGGYNLKVPRGKGKLASALDSLPEYKPPQPRYVVHRIRQGDTLSGLARRYRVKVADICRVNRIRPNSILRIGQKLRIPNRRGARKARRRGRSAKAVKKARRFVEVVVKPGDSMWGLARRYGSDVDTIKRLNGLRDYSLRVGQKLRIPSSGRQAAAAERHGPSKPGSSESVGTYSVQPGDTLFSIAKRHGMKLQRLLDLNGLEENSAIRPGQVIRVERKD